MKHLNHLDYSQKYILTMIPTVVILLTALGLYIKFLK